MKKPRIAVLFCLATLPFIVAACTTNTSTPSTRSSASSTTSSATEAPTATTETVATTETTTADMFSLAWGDTAEADGLEITVSAPVDDTANLDDVKKMLLTEGHRAFYCMVTLVNHGSDAFAYNALAFTLYDASGFTYDALWPLSSQPKLGSGQLLPGRTVKGAIAYKLPTDAEPAYVDFRPGPLDTVKASWGH